MATSFKKDPNAVLDYTFDWTAWLLPLLDTIVTATFIPDAGLTVDSSSHTTTTATAFVSGGTEGTSMNLTCRITTAGGRTDDRTIVLKIVNR
jgi:hypothetical protein